MYILWFVYSSVHEHVGLYHLLAIVNSSNNAVMNLGIQVSVWISVFSSFMYVSGNGIIGLNATLCLIFWGTVLCPLDSWARTDVNRCYQGHFITPQPRVDSGRITKGEFYHFISKIFSISNPSSLLPTECPFSTQICPWWTLPLSLQEKREEVQ